MIDAVPTADPPLGDEAIRHYRERGFLIPEYRLTRALTQELRAACDRMIAADPERRPEHLMNPHLLTWPGEENPFMRVAAEPGILDMVEQLIGPDLVLWITRILCKPAGDGQEVPWHQDGQYWPIRPLGTCSVWIALDPVDRGNGCMRFIPGSHRRETLYGHRTSTRKNLVLDQEVIPGEFDVVSRRAHDSWLSGQHLEPPARGLDTPLLSGQLAFRPYDPQCFQLTGIRGHRPAAHAGAWRGPIGSERFRARSRHVDGAPGNAENLKVANAVHAPNTRPPAGRPATPRRSPPPPDRVCHRKPRARCARRRLPC